MWSVAGQQSRQSRAHDHDSDPGSRAEAAHDGFHDESHCSEDRHDDATQRESDSYGQDCLSWEERTQGSLVEEEGFDPSLGWHDSVHWKHSDHGVASSWTGICSCVTRVARRGTCLDLRTQDWRPDLVAEEEAQGDMVGWREERQEASASGDTLFDVMLLPHVQRLKWQARAGGEQTCF